MMTKPFDRGLIFLLLFIVVCHERPVCAEQKSVALFPFSVYSETSMDFIKKGAGDLIEARMSGKGIKISRSETESGRAEAVKQASDTGCDALVTGSLTFLGNSVSISALLVDTKTGSVLVSYSKSDPDKNSLFTHLSEFSDQALNALTSTSGVKAAESPVPPSDAPAVEKKPDPVPSAAVPATPPLAPRSPVLTSGIRRSQDLNCDITAISVGDVDGDKKREIVYAERHSFTVASFQKKTLDIIKRVECKSYLDILFIDTYDANKNGMDEIFVTAVHVKSGKVESSVYEWNGRDYALSRGELPYFFRSGKSPETGNAVLLGQEQHLGGVFSESIYEMIWSAGRQNYIPLKVFKTPEKNFHIYGMESGNIKNDGGVTSLVYLPDDRLAMFDFKKQSTWKSSGAFGGTSKYIEIRNQDTNPRFYFPARLMTGDFDKNGTTECATLVNTNSTPRIFNNLRNYTEGRVECMEWKALSFETLWKTQNVSGYIPDFFISDLDGNGQNDVIFPVVNKTGLILSKPVTYIVVQPIGS